MGRLSFALMPLLLSAFPAWSASFVNGQAARAVVGQANFTDATSATAQNVLGGVSGLAYANGLLMTADSNRLGASPQNNRVLFFPTSQIPGPYDEVGQTAHTSTTCYVCGWNAGVVIGQQDFVSNTAGRSGVPTNLNATNYAGSLNGAVAVASDGQYFAIADTDNNRVLLWNSIPTNSTTPPNVVLGQADANAFQTPQVVNANSLRGPQGVWIKNGKLFVADTQNNRVLIWTSIPTSNNAPANVVLGQTSFTSNSAPAPSPGYASTTSSKLYTPVAVTSDGTHLFVADLGSSRILIWNSIPNSNAQPADVVIGQPDMTTGVPNWTPALCGDSSATTGTPCEKTLDFPRFALSDGTRLFVADGGNDRVLIYNTIPTVNGAAADIVLGQPDFRTNIVTNQAASIASTAIDNTSSVDTIPAPTSLAWDGTNLYVSDAFNRRVLLFSQADVAIPVNSVLNWASEIIRQEGVVVLGVTTINASDTATITIAGTAYTYTVKSGDTLQTITQGLISAINANAGDPNVTALLGSPAGTIYLSSKNANLAFDAISLSTSVSNTTNLSIAASGSYLSAGTAATASPGMLVEINAPYGASFTDQTGAIPDPPSSNIATSLAGVEVFMDGIPQPVIKVSPTQIVSLVPWTFNDRNSSSIYVRAVHSDGTIAVSNATSAYIAPANPGLFSDKSSGTPPYPALNAHHQRGNPQAVVSIDGTAKAGDTLTITIAGSRSYSYTVVTGKELLGYIVQGLGDAINNGNDPDVVATVGAAFDRLVIVARQPGAAGNGIGVTTSTSTNAQATVTAYNATTCCDVTPGAPITVDNPAGAGETIVLSGAGLGSIGSDPTAGILYSGPFPNTATNSVSATMSGTTAQIVAAGLDPGSYGKYSIDLIVPSTQAANNATQVYIAQNAFVSNIVTIPIGTPVPYGTPSPTPTPTPTPAPTPTPNPTPTPVCTYSLSSTSKSYLSGANSGAIAVTTQSGCAWTSSVDQSWVTLTKSASLSGTDYISFNLAANTSGADRTANLTVAGQNVAIRQNANAVPPASPLQYVPLAAPCRAVDTRLAQAPLVSGGSIRSFAISSACGIPATAQAYAMNATVVPANTLTYLQLWAAGAGQPATSVVNSYDGRIKANATIVQAGSNGSVAAYATDDTQVILDVSGYYIQSGLANGLAFYPLTPCRIADTRIPAGALGSPSLAAGQARTFPVLSSGCNIPAGAQAYSLNVTAIPKAPLLYLTAWPGGQSQPATSTLNAPTGATTANAAIVQAGAGGAVSVYSTANSDLVLDINGYYAPPGSSGALNLYVPTPCRALDTRDEAIFGPITGTFVGANMYVSGCNVPANAQAFVFNATAVPVNTLSYLTLWATGNSQPLVSTLNAYDGAVTSNLAIVPSGGGSINIFTTDSSYLIFDILGIFAP